MMILVVVLAILMVLVAVTLALMKLDALGVWFAVVLWHVMLFVVLASCSYFF